MGKREKGTYKPVIMVNMDHDTKNNNLTAPFNYLLALERAGALPLLVPPGIEKQDFPQVLEHSDGIVFIGGPDYDPHLYGEELHEENFLISEARQEFDLALARYVLDEGFPVFAICGGHQLLNIVTDGSLYTSVQTQVPGALTHRWPTFPPQPVYHQVTIDKACRLFSGLGSGEIKTNSYHHQAVKKLGTGLRITARTADGVVEGLEKPGAPVYGVQWHPEKELDDPLQQQLFRNFVEICRESRK